VKFLTGRAYQIKVSYNQIERNAGVPVEEQHLVCNGKPMNPMTTLSAEGGVPGLSISVKFLTGRAYQIKVSYNQIERNAGVPVEEQHLVFNGKPMNPMKALPAEGVVPGSTIHVVRRARGEYR